MASLPLPPASISKTNNLKHPQCTIQSIDANFNPQFSAKGLQCNRSHSTLVKAQLNEDAEIFESKLEGSNSSEKKDVKPGHAPVSLVSEASIAEFMTQVSSLVKLVDSRDIVELQMKQSDCELVIRKNKALPQPSVPDNVVMMHSPPPEATTPPPEAATPPAFAPAPTPAPISSPTQVPAPSPSGMEKSSHQSLKCPMAGTFYQCSGPGEPPFVKVGDKVQKGQVVCIIEAMKLMNEIEADRSGTIVEVLVEDGKPVSVDTPLFVIEP